MIQPQFHAQFPQFTFKYSGSATGAAILAAENGTGGPSALIVHAPSLENQFVAQGFSLNNQFGNAIFTNDFILAGPATADAAHANVASNASNNIVQAFADVATAGNGGTATFESRGGSSTAPGTTVAEHGIWNLLNSSGLKPPDSVLVLCKVSDADGGGMTPIKSSVQATSGQDCPDGGTVIQTDAPSWYLINTGNQANNVNIANACTAAPGGANSCYVFTDRGTFDFLSSSNSPSAPNGIPNLTILTRNNSASAPGGANALINYFHVYIINPSKPGETVNTTAAQDFVNFLTSPTFQAQVKVYLNTTTDPGGPPFVPDASPVITQSGLPSLVAGGKTVTVTGTVTNAEPAFPALSGKTVSVDQIAGAIPVHVASGTTDTTGHYSITFTPTSSGSYQVSTGAISQIEIASLNPAYGDILSPAATPAGTMNVRGVGVDHVGEVIVRRRECDRKGRSRGAGRERDGHRPRPSSGLQGSLHQFRRSDACGPTEHVRGQRVATAREVAARDELPGSGTDPRRDERHPKRHGPEADHVGELRQDHRQERKADGERDAQPGADHKRHSGQVVCAGDSRRGCFVQAGRENLGEGRQDEVHDPGEAEARIRVRVAARIRPQGPAVDVLAAENGQRSLGTGDAKASTLA